MKRLVIAWDLDGTLISSAHRQRFNSKGEFDLEYWKYTQKTKDILFKDELLPLAQLFYEFQKTGFTQICVTARDMHPLDFEFLKTHKLDFDLILHRESSLELDEVLKDKALTELFQTREAIPFQAYDDKKENLEIFDKHGFRTFHAAYMNEVLKAKKRSDIKVKPSDF